MTHLVRTANVNRRPKRSLTLQSDKQNKSMPNVSETFGILRLGT
jgi:hypothetical protein